MNTTLEDKTNTKMDELASALRQLTVRENPRTALEIIRSCRNEGWKHYDYGATVMISKNGKEIKVVLQDGRTVTSDLTPLTPAEKQLGADLAERAGA